MTEQDWITIFVGFSGAIIGAVVGSIATAYFVSIQAKQDKLNTELGKFNIIKEFLLFQHEEMEQFNRKIADQHFTGYESILKETQLKTELLLDLKTLAELGNYGHEVTKSALEADKIYKEFLSLLKNHSGLTTQMQKPSEWVLAPNRAQEKITTFCKEHTTKAEEFKKLFDIEHTNLTSK